MLNLDIPKFSISDIHTAVTRRGAKEVRKRLVSGKKGLERAEASYHQHGLKVDLHKIVVSIGGDFGSALDADIELVYDNRLVKRGGSGHIFYERILYTGDGICALCGASHASEIDHYLPKEHFKRLAILPINLLPACSECNGKKGTFVPKCRNEAYIHPYYDSFIQDSWLTSDVVDGDPVPRFRVDRESNIAAADLARIENQFGNLGLSFMYAKFAGGVLTEYSDTISNKFPSVGEELLRRGFLELTADTLERRKGSNFWRVAALRAWARSDWFVEEGFAQELDAEWVINLAKQVKH